MDLYQKAKFYSISKFTTTALSLLASASKENLIRLSYLAERIPQKESYREKIRWIRTLFQTDHPALTIARRLLSETHPYHRKKIITNFIINQLLVGTNRRRAFELERGFKPPNAMLISPTMRCNLNCFGCYSGSYSTREELPFDVMDRLVRECNEMGIYLVILTGGEPFIRRDLFDLFEKHPDTIFQVYTNGTLIDETMVKRFVALGNVVPAISLEGMREETDRRRGAGHFERMVRVMDHLKRAGIFFAISTTQTKLNTETIGSDPFIDFLVEKGCIFLWNFHYIPIGRDADLSLMATPEQRAWIRERFAYFRATKPLLMVDFWNDGCLTEGCIAGGRKYFHVNARGDLEPCVFCHFAYDNVKETPLMEALNSPLFQEIRSRQPFSENLFINCPLIDHPEHGREFALKFARYFTHEGAEGFFTELAPAIEAYSKTYREMAEAAWKERMARNAHQGLPNEKKVAGLPRG